MCQIGGRMQYNTLGISWNNCKLITKFCETRCYRNFVHIFITNLAQWDGNRIHNYINYQNLCHGFSNSGVVDTPSFTIIPSIMLNWSQTSLILIHAIFQGSLFPSTKFPDIPCIVYIFRDLFEKLSSEMHIRSFFFEYYTVNLSL